VVPGALTQKECVKYSEFNRADLVVKANSMGTSRTFCGCCALTQKYNSKLISPTTAELIVLKEQFAASNLLDIKVEDVLDFKNSKNWGGSTDEVQCAYKYGDLDSVFSDSKPHPYSFQSSFSNRTLIQFNAYNKQFIDSHNLWAKFRKHSFNGSNTYFTEKYAVEWDNAGFRNATLNHNLMAFVDAPTVFYNGKTRYVNDTKKYGALNAKMAGELDAKVDDGRPGSGRVLAMKSAMAHVSATNDKYYMENCYDKNATEINKAIYHSSNDLKYGCNIIKVMEDVK